MKGAFEFGIILMFSLPMVVFGLNFMEIAMTYNQARQYQNYVVMQIEHQNNLNEQVYELIEEGKKYCSTCHLDINEMNNRYDVKVTFPIDINLIDYHTQGITHMMTQIIK
ncbi:MAG: hypothetical protein ACI4U3_03105 [Traorella sp.]